MSFPTLPQLAVQTVKDPAGAARALLALDLPRRTLWTGLMLMAVLQSLVFGFSRIIAPGPMPLEAVFGSPLRFALLAAMTLVLTVYALYWAGRALGGSGRLEDVMVLVVWLQVLRVLVQVGVLILSLTVPLLALLLILVATGLSIWILLHFVDQAHRLGSLARAFGVLVIALVGMIFGLSFLLALFGAPIMGQSGYV